jgi:hypothetical protein
MRNRGEQGGYAPPEERDEGGWTALFGWLKELSQERILQTGLVLYICGFVITNLYLGSCGIVSVEILRSRYILTGLLFSIFVLMVFWSTRDVLKQIQQDFRRTRSESRSNSRFPSDRPLLYVINIFFYTIQTWLPLSLGVLLLAVLTRSRHVFSEQGSLFDHWNPDWELVAVSSAQIAFALLLIPFLVVGISFFLGDHIHRPISFNQKRDNGITSRLFISTKLFLKDCFDNIFVWIFYFFISFGMIFVVRSGVTLLLATIDRLPTDVPHESEGWLRLLLLSFSLYAIATMILLWFLAVKLVTTQGYFPTNKEKEDKSPTTSESSFPGILITVILGFLILPSYVLGVYPYLPAQIGGGRPVAVHVTLVPETDLKEGVYYLLDRTYWSTILIKRSLDHTNVFEIPNDSIRILRFVSTKTQTAPPHDELTQSDDE